MLEVIKCNGNLSLDFLKAWKDRRLGALLTVQAETVRREKSLPVGHKLPAWLSAGEQNPADSAKGYAKCKV